MSIACDKVLFQQVLFCSFCTPTYGSHLAHEPEVTDLLSHIYKVEHFSKDPWEERSYKFTYNFLCIAALNSRIVVCTMTTQSIHEWTVPYCYPFFFHILSEFHERWKHENTLHIAIIYRNFCSWKLRGTTLNWTMFASFYTSVKEPESIAFLVK